MKSEPKQLRRFRGVIRCAYCKEPLGEIAIRNMDPFCRTQCCRAWYGVELPPPEPRVGRYGVKV